MTKITPTGAAFPWGLLTQTLLLLIAVIAEVVERSKKKSTGDPSRRRTASPMRVEGLREAKWRQQSWKRNRAR